MANTCDTAYKLYGSKESINSIWNVLAEMGIEEHIVWLGDLAEHCGIDYEERGYSVRGNIWSATCPERKTKHLQWLSEQKRHGSAAMRL